MGIIQIVQMHLQQQKNQGANTRHIDKFKFDLNMSKNGINHIKCQQTQLFPTCDIN